MLDTYVCGACPGAADTNPGTQQLPVATIAQGFANAALTGNTTVFLAATYAGAPMTYTEAVVVPAGLTLSGRYAVTNAGGMLVWARTGPRSSIVDTTPTGLTFATGATRTTIVEGVTIQAAAAGTRVVGMTVASASPLVRDFAITAPPLSSTLPAQAIGISVTGGGLATPSPRFEGTNTVPSTVTAGTATTSSSGLLADSAMVDAQFTQFNGGAAVTLSHGVSLTNSMGSTLRDGTASAGAADTCMGALVTGRVDGVLLERMANTGCPRITGSASTATPRVGFGVLFDTCSTGPMAAPPIVREGSASGGVVGGTGSSANGAAAAGGCGVSFQQGFYTGASGVPASGPGPQSAVGVVCTNLSYLSMTGLTDSRCNINGATIMGGFASGAQSYGMICAGSCQGQPGTCRGSCEGVVANQITAATGTTLTHLLVMHSSPQVQRNRIGYGGNGTFCGAGATAIGVQLLGSGASVVNNIILGGPCERATGLVNSLFPRSDGTIPSPLIQHNTIVATSGNPAMNTFSVGVQNQGAPGTIGTQVSGLYRSNIINAGPVTGASPTLFGFMETGTTGDPVELRNNLFFVQTPALNAPLYFNEGSTPLTNIGAINALSDCDAGANLEGDPMFVNRAIADFHITSASPARDGGSNVGVPTVDVDGDARPTTQPDIGADEIP
jgi:hypothetical protein